MLYNSVQKIQRNSQYDYLYDEIFLMALVFILRVKPVL